jgi:hypothetical protein
MNEATKSLTLAEAFPLEQARLRELCDAYRDIGPAGAFGLAMIRLTLKRADEAAASHDTVAMLRSYEEMKDCQ